MTPALELAIENVAYNSDHGNSIRTELYALVEAILAEVRAVPTEGDGSYKP